VDNATGGSGEASAEEYDLTAEVVNKVSLIVNAASTTFASVQAGVSVAASQKIVITVTNGSTGDNLTTRQATSPLQVTLSDAINFGIHSSSTCLSSSGAYVALPNAVTGNSCTLVIDFAPLAAGAMTTDVAVAGASPIKVTLTGTGLSDLSITTPATPPTFSGTPLATIVTVHNNGSQTTQLLREKLTGTNASAFVITDDTCYGTPLSHVGTCTVTVTFTGTVNATTAQTVSLNVTDGTANNTVSVALSVGGPPT
jgi:hypothetical protein